jgi:uncharacterized protein (DUF433 family)
MTTWREYIHGDPAILGGKPVIRGTRISVDFILQLISGGWSEADIVQQYPHLHSEGIRAAVEFARDLVSEETFVSTRKAVGG